jgi:hypothetical protein
MPEIDKVEERLAEWREEVKALEASFVLTRKMKFLKQKLAIVKKIALGEQWLVEQRVKGTQ